MEKRDIAEKYGLDIERLERDQLKLAKNLEIKDSIDFSSVDRIGAIENILVKNQILSVAIVCDNKFNILEQQYFLDRLKFPYIYGFRSYRELPCMIGAFNKLNEKPDVVFIHGPGIIHPRLGLASHFSISVGIPTIGISDSIFEENKIEGEDIIMNGKKIGRVVCSKQKSNPLYISPGNSISLETSYKLCEEYIKEPHKLPEPLHVAHKYAKEVREELKL